MFYNDEVEKSIDQTPSSNITGAIVFKTRIEMSVITLDDRNLQKA